MDCRSETCQLCLDCVITEICYILQYFKLTSVAPLFFWRLRGFFTEIFLRMSTVSTLSISKSSSQADEIVQLPVKAEMQRKFWALSKCLRMRFHAVASSAVIDFWNCFISRSPLIFAQTREPLAGAIKFFFLIAELFIIFLTRCLRAHEAFCELNADSAKWLTGSGPPWVLHFF